MRYCTHCGAQLSEGAKFCMSCGKLVQGMPAAGSEPPAEATAPIPAMPAPVASTPAASVPAEPAPAATPSWQQSPTWQTQRIPQAEQYNGQSYQYAPAGGAYVPVGTVAAPPKKRSKGVVAGVVIAIVAVIAAVVFGLWWFLWRGDDLNPAGRYTM